MTDYAQILRKVQSDSYYKNNLSWGRPRFGHPEGSLKAHIEQLEKNLLRVRKLLKGEEEAQLRLLIHVHDICKPDATAGLPSSHPDNHAFLAKGYLARFCSEKDLLAITLHHDDGYRIFKMNRKGSHLDEVFAQIEDLELFLIFSLVDGCTPGKIAEPVDWLLREAGKRIKLTPRIEECLRILRSVS